MRVINKQQILHKFDQQHALQAIESAFIQFAQGKAQLPPVVHLDFPSDAGECHVKSAHLAGEPYFVIKIATGFYENAAKGLPSGNGMMVAMSATTGEPVALLDDAGVLTDLRTALAGVLATRVSARADATRLGIIGAGVQARLQAQMICELLGYSQVAVWARSADKQAALVDALAAQLPNIAVSAAATREALCAGSDTIVTTTPATTPVVSADWVAPGTHITAVGADSPGKQELDAALFARARWALVDSHEQCAAHGELSHALARNLIQAENIITLGDALAGALPARNAADITIADLTGLGIQDAAIAGSVLSRIAAG